MKTVSIIVPFYNANSTICRCINSILIQTYSMFELILVNDGSSDNSPQLCEQYEVKDNRIIVIHQQNSGVSVARNRGIEAATGKYLMFVDADDWLEPHALETALQYMDEQTDIVTFSFSNEYKRQSVPSILEKDCISIVKLFENYEKKYETVLCTVWNKLYKTELLKKQACCFPNEIKFGEDFIFNTRVFSSVDSITILPDVLYHYDCTNDNSSVKKLYSNYDVFINAMDYAALELLTILSINKESAELFRQNFISDRWNYITDICIHADLEASEKSRLLKGWINNMPVELLKCSKISDGQFGNLFFLRESDCHATKELEKEIKRHLYREKCRNTAATIKRAVKHILCR